MAAFYILEQLRRLPLKKMPNYKIIVQQQRHKERFIIIMISGVLLQLLQTLLFSLLTAARARNF